MSSREKVSRMQKKLFPDRLRKSRPISQNFPLLLLLFLMSSTNKSFHNEIAETLSHDIDLEVLDQNISLLSAQKPKISINPEYRDRLRKTLVSQKKETTAYFSFQRFFSFSFVSFV